jgi:hypothetical protein
MKNSPGQYTKADSDEARDLPSTGLITRQQHPKNLETPADQLDSFLTPPSCSTYAAISLLRWWMFPLTSCVSMVRSGIRFL